MSGPLVFAVHNTIAAAVLAVMVYAVTRVWRYPPLAHALWLLVLLKLVTPPMYRVAWTPIPDLIEPRPGEHARAELPRHLESHESPATGVVDRDAAVLPSGPSATRLRAAQRQAIISSRMWTGAQEVLLWTWLGGAAWCASVAGARIWRFERRMREMLPASARVERLSIEAARRLGVVRVPGVRYTDDLASPLVWCLFGRGTIVLPMPLVAELDDRQLAMVLAHELAHLRRRDHWVRRIELVVSTIYWWNPLVWYVRRELERAEEMCCDGWACSAIAGGARDYAEMVLKAAELISVRTAVAAPQAASLFLRSVTLKARIEMILHSRFKPQCSRTSWWMIALLAAVVLPLSVQMRPVPTWAAAAGGADKGTASETETASQAAALPYRVAFEQGATKFLDGDEITILEVHGTAKTFVPGNIYLIKGKYKLDSHNRASLAAFTTAKHAKDGTSRTLSVQTTPIEQGEGEFSLYLPMACEGWPHVSFYAVENSVRNAAAPAKREVDQAKIDQLWEAFDQFRQGQRTMPGSPTTYRSGADVHKLESQLAETLGPRSGSIRPGEGFGGNYIGTGDSVLKKWWGEK